MSGRVAIVTGASSGIGYQVTEYLCSTCELDVVMACRNEEKAKAAIEKLKQLYPNALLTYIHLDLASMTSVRKFVEEFHGTGKSLNILINNAGIRLSNRDRMIQYTEDCFELTMATNYIGHFLLTNLLVNDLKSEATGGNTARVINVTSAGHDVKACGPLSGIQPLDLDNLFLLKHRTYNSQQAYKNSKLANVMFTYELARILEKTGVKVNAVAPGFVPSTELLRNAAAPQRFFQRSILDGVLKFAKLTNSVQEAAMFLTRLATDDEYNAVTGKFFSETAEAASSDESLNLENQKRLWEVTAGYCHLEGYPPQNISPPTSRRRSDPPKSTKEGEKNKATTSDPPKKSKATTTPESDKKPKRMFSWGRGRKEEAPSSAVDKEPGPEEMEMNNFCEDVGGESELQDSIRGIDLSTDGEEKPGKAEGESKEKSEEVKEDGRGQSTEPGKASSAEEPATEGSDKMVAEREVEAGIQRGRWKAEDKHGEEKVEDKSGEGKTEDESAEEKVEEKSHQEKAVEKPAEKTEYKSTEERVEEKTVEEKAEDKSPEEKAEDQSPEEKVEEKATEEKAAEKSPENKVEEKATEEKAAEKSPEKKVEEKAAEEKAEKKSPEKKVEEKAAEEKVEKKSPEKKVEEKAAEGVECIKEENSEQISEEKAGEKAEKADNSEKVKANGEHSATTDPPSEVKVAG